MSRKRKKSNVITLAVLEMTDINGKPAKLKIRGHKRSVKKREQLAELQKTLTDRGGQTWLNEAEDNPQN